MKIKETFVARFFLWVVNISLYGVLILYVCLGSSFTFSWGKTLWQRHYPIETLYERIDAERQNGDLKAAVKIIGARKNSESQALLDLLLPHAGELEPSFFFEFARRYVILDNPSEALFWAQLGRLRLRFDFLRCNNLMSKEMSDKFVEFFMPREITAYLELYPEELMPALKRVLEWDENNPPPRAMLFDCKLLTRMAPNTAGEILPEKHWDDLRTNLREAGKRFLKDQGEGLEKK